MIKFIAFSDIHGNVNSVKSMEKCIRDQGLNSDFLLFAGDFTNFYVHNDRDRAQRTLEEIETLLQKIGESFFFVKGNRDFSLPKFGDLSHSFGKDLRKTTIEIGDYTITGDSERFNKSDLTLRHGPSPSYEKQPPNSLLHVEGHEHYGYFLGSNGSYALNTGFMYRGDYHNANKIGPGGFFIVEISGKTVTHKYISLPGSILEKKECPQHGGPFYVAGWTKCPVCYKEKKLTRYLKRYLPQDISTSASLTSYEGSSYSFLITKIYHETEKAYLCDVKDIESEEIVLEKKWVPKSAVKRFNDGIRVQNWLIKEKRREEGEKA